MKKLLERLVFGLTFLVFGLLLTRPLLAQQGVTRIKSEPVDMDIDAIYIPCEDPANELCVPFPTGGVHPVPSKMDHEISISAQGFDPNTDVYIVGCVTTLSGARCSTGDSNLDSQLNQMPGGNFMNPDSTHQFKAATNPVKSDATGKVTVIVRTYTPQTVDHYFQAYVIEEQDLSTSTVGRSGSVTPEEALHLQDFTIIQPTAKPVRIPTIRERRERRLKNDPKGRLFDTKSLEPVPGGEMTLLDSLKRLYTEPNFVNPLIVLPNGEFNFWVPNGIYYLNVSKLPAGYSWPVEMPQVHPNYNLAYYCDVEVKDEATGQPVPLYYQQFSITEFNKLVHCDIPIDPGTREPYRGDVKTLTYGVERTSADNSIIYSGKQTHPFTKVELLGKSSGRVVGSVEADKLGFWNLEISFANYPLTKDGLPDQVEVRYTKRDLTENTQFRSVVADSFDPILSYIEGYAYNNQGKVIPNADVGIKQKNADSVVYLTSANEQGFFRIGTQYLPTVPYEIIFTDAQGRLTVQASTSQFVERNKDYLAEKQLNLISTDKRDVPLTKSAVVKFASLSQRVQSDEGDSEAAGNATTNPVQKNSLIGVFVVFLLLMVGGGLVAMKFFARKNNSQPPL